MSVSPPPDHVDLARIFRHWTSLRSARDWEDEGFDLLRYSKHDKIIVLHHEDAPRYLFKKFGRDHHRSPSEQFEKYAHRIRGAAMLRDHVTAQRLRHVVVPQKWLCELPAQPGSRGMSPHVVIVERHKILDADESAWHYQHIDAEVAREVCTVVRAFQDLDFTVRNAPFTRDGKISFIDTEYVNRRNSQSIQRDVAKMLSRYQRLAQEHHALERQGMRAG